MAWTDGRLEVGCPGDQTIAWWLFLQGLMAMPEGTALFFMPAGTTERFVVDAVLK